MSAWEIPLAALQGYGPAVAVLVPMVVTSHGANALLLPMLVQHPRHTLRKQFAKRRREKHHEWRTRTAALVRGAGAITLVMFGAFTTSVLALLATRTTDMSWLRLATYGALAIGLQVGHAFLAVRTALRGARLYESHEAWKAKFKEDKNIWLVLTFRMPLRAHDLLWVVCAMISGFVYPLVVFVREVHESDAPASYAQQWALVGAIVIVILISAAVLSLLERATPQLTLARWASDQLISPNNLLRRARQPVGPRVAPVLEIYVRRRLRRLPSSLKERYLATCDKLIEVNRIGYMQQNTRQAVHHLMRDALQYSARIANSLDASEAERMASAWLSERGLADIYPTPLPSRRRFPTVQSVGEVTDTVKTILATIAAIVLVVILIINRAGLDEIISQLK